MDRRLLLIRLSTGSYNNVPFADFLNLIEGFGFSLDRIRGSHHYFTRPGVRQIVNVQPHRGEAKPYQIRQFLRLVEQYNLQMEGDQ